MIQLKEALELILPQKQLDDVSASKLSAHALLALFGADADVQHAAIFKALCNAFVEVPLVDDTDKCLQVRCL